MSVTKSRQMGKTISASLYHGIHDAQTYLQVEYLNDPERCNKIVCEEIIKAVRHHLTVGDGFAFLQVPYDGLSDEAILSYLLKGVVHFHDLQRPSLNHIRSVTPFQWYLPFFVVIQKQMRLEKSFEE